MLSQQRHFNHGVVWIVFLAQVAALCFLDPLGLWITDNENKVLQVQAILRSGYQDYSIPWLGRDVDPDFACSPLPPPFGVSVDGRIYSQYPPFFAAISAPFFRMFGYPGLLVLPLLGSLLALFAVSRLAGVMCESSWSRSLAVAMAGLCTPLWFYSLIFWEHVPAIALILWSLCFGFQFVQKNATRALVSCVALAMGAVYLREELILFFVLMVMWIVHDKPGKRVATAVRAILLGAGCLIPLWVFNFMTLGTPVGFHVASNVTGFHEHLASRFTVLYDLLVAAHPWLWVSLIISAPFIVLFIWRPALPDRSFARNLSLLAVIGLLCFGVSLGGYLTASSPILAMLSSNGLFAASPILLLGLVASGPKDGRRVLSRLWGLALGYTALYAVAAPEISSQGIHWGNRYLLPVYPLLALCASANIGRCLCPGTGPAPHAGWKVPVIALLAASLFAQCYSLRLLQRKEVFSVRLNEAVRETGEKTLVTNIWWVPQALHTVFFDKEIFFTATPEAAGRLETRLRRHGRQSCIFLTSAACSLGMKPEVIVSDDGLNCFSLALFRLRVPGAADSSLHGD